MSDAFDQIKNLKNGNYTTANSYKNTSYSSTNFGAEPEFSLKGFVLKYGRKLVDFNTAIGIFVAIVAFFVMLAAFLSNLNHINNYNFNPQETLCMFLFTVFAPLIIMILVILSNYLLYLLIDIRDALNKIKNHIE